MSDKLFSIYRSSAGSGKTRTLAREYLKLALQFKADYYKHILAVTFTNKATQEMKNRILAYLDAFANGRNDSLALELMNELKMDVLTFKNNCQALQSEILHNYSQFSISTIDAFFQKVIRAFTREAGLSGDYRLEIDQEEVIEEIVDKLVDELGSNHQLTQWIIEFAKENLENDRAWDVRSSLIDFAKEIFQEKFRAIEDELMHSTSAPGYFKNLQTALRKECFTFIGIIKKYALEALTIIHSNGWTKSDFKYDGGIYNFLVKMNNVHSVEDLDEEYVGKRARKEFLDSKNWSDKNTLNASGIQQKAESLLIPLLKTILEYRDKHYKTALSAEVVLNNFYAFGLVADLSRKLREHKEENNMMLLADAPKFLQGIIQDSDTPFIYEKIGSFYRNYLIDEFQDTSGMQWSNFKPLLINSLDQGYPGMVVGDVKQSIYRWRGGDLKLLQQEVEHQIDPDRVVMKELSSNFRSAVTVVNFNNAFFEAASVAAERETGEKLVYESYRDVTQQISKEEEGFVKVQFIRQPDKEISWKEEALLNIPKQLEQFQDCGITLRDVAILVRNNREGIEVAEYLLQYKNQQAITAYRYDVISNESLRIEGAITVSIIVSALKYMVNPEDLIARAQLSYDYGRLHDNTNLQLLFSISDRESFKKKLPVAFTKEKGHLKKLPLYELTETLIEIFELGKVEGELTYLQTFQNLVLDFSTRERNDISAFLEWWDENKGKKSIQVSGEVDAVQIITIHKSKGLQFKYVLIPFCSWDVDHSPQKSPTLWVKANEAPFLEAAYVPVKYSSTLKNTIFSETYLHEKMRSYLDNLNLLYVAFTRAELGLFINAPHPDVPRSGNIVAKILYNVITQSSALSENWNEATSVWQKGTLVNPTEVATKKKENGFTLQRYEVSRWRKRMVLRRKSGNIFREYSIGDNENRKRGLLLHAVFSRIQYLHNYEEEFTRIVREGLLQQKEVLAVQTQFNTLLQNELVASWFDPTWEVRTEAPILSPGKPDVRVDRIMLKENQAVVVDYKTGEPRQSDEEQVAAYMKILREMNYVNVEGYLLYVNTGTVVKIDLTKAARKNVKDQNQLDLELL